MLQTIFKKLEEVLKKDERLASDDGRLLKNKAVELANKLDEGLVKIIFDDAKLKDTFFKKVAGLTLFDKDLFIEFVSNKEFLPDSYTAFKNKIGLAIDKNYLKQDREVTLVWPYKDCVLEGGQTKEEAKRGEIFWNTTLAPEEINRLLEPKVLTNWKRYDKENSKKEHKATEIRDNDNLIIKGNNLLALHSLKKHYGGRVNLIYIDPPYNTGNDGFNYNDNFNHSAWLTFMRNRLEVAKELLANDGSIYLQLDYNEVHYAKILMDEIFGRENFQREIIWDISVLSGYKTLANNWIRGHDSILFYSKDKTNFKFNKIYVEHTQKYIDMFNKEDKGGKYLIAHGSKRYLKDVLAKGKPIGDVWGDIMSFQQQPTSGERMEFAGQKPETLLKRIIASSTNEGDLVLDYHAGTGTTGAVAHKMNRQYILIEQMDYIHDLPESRLKAVIEGEQSGISKAVGWKGGGSFVYAELMPLNEKFVREIEAAKSEKEVLKIWEAIQKSGFVSYRVDSKKFDENAKEFTDLDLAKQKKFVLESLDANMLYVNYSDIGDKEYGVGEEDKKLNGEFYDNASPRV
ncbi:TPA: hypothetical protein DDZ10_04335 [Candidatus Uhrbacteria bacterium]|nr:MAG: methylase N-4/N-6 domain protein [Parcubacteria group bacterium GW2011_GWA2_53_21]HBL39865.1 hypothetical protein [Candidatus Uhrbacteria bacterium]